MTPGVTEALRRSQEPERRERQPVRDPAYLHHMAHIGVIGWDEISDLELCLIVAHEAQLASELLRSGFDARGRLAVAADEKF